jgi:hypothetical protein
MSKALAAVEKLFAFKKQLSLFFARHLPSKIELASVLRSHHSTGIVFLLY